MVPEINVRVYLLHPMDVYGLNSNIPLFYSKLIVFTTEPLNLHHGINTLIREKLNAVNKHDSNIITHKTFRNYSHFPIGWFSSRK